MDSSMDNRYLKEVLKQMENLRLSTPVRKNDNTDDNKENILAGQDISRIKSEEKGTETTSSPVFNSRDSNQSVNSIDKFSDALNLEGDSKNSTPPHLATQPKLDVENSEISPETNTSDPFVYHCSNLQQTVLKKNNSENVDEEQVSGNSLKGLKEVPAVSVCERGENLGVSPTTEGNLNRSFIESEEICHKNNSFLTYPRNLKSPLFTSNELQQALTDSDEDIVQSINCEKIVDSQEPEQNLNTVNEIVSTVLGNSDSFDKIVENSDYSSPKSEKKYHPCFSPVKPEEVSLNNSRRDRVIDGLPTNNLNSTQTILRDDSLEEFCLSEIEISEQNIRNKTVCVDNVPAESTFILEKNDCVKDEDLAAIEFHGDVLKNSSDQELGRRIASELNDPEIHPKQALKLPEAIHFSQLDLGSIPEQIPNPPDTINKDDIYELSNSTIELSVYEDCRQVDENISNITTDVISDVNKLQEDISQSIPVIEISGEKVETENISESDQHEQEIDILLNITAVNGQEENIDKSSVDLVCDSPGRSSNTLDSIKVLGDNEFSANSELSFTVGTTTTGEYSDSSQESGIEEISDPENIPQKEPDEIIPVNKSFSAFIVVSPQKRNAQITENLNIVDLEVASQLNNSHSTEHKTEQVEEKIICHPVEVKPNASLNLDNLAVNVIENSEKDLGHERLTTIENSNIPDTSRINLKEMADINEKLQQENSDLKLELNASKQAKASLELEMGKKDEIILKTQAEALKKEQQLQQDIKALKEQLKEKSSLNEKDFVKELEEALKEAKAKESHALGELNARMNDEMNYRKIMEEYEKTIAARIADCQKLKEENDTLTRHLGNLELSFSDLHQKYERSKNIIDGYKTNEEKLREKFVIFEETNRKQEEKYESLKAHARAQIEKSNKEIIQHREKYDSEVNKLNAIIKRLEIKSAALETSLEQKTQECIALAALCDEVTGKKV